MSRSQTSSPDGLLVREEPNAGFWLKEKEVAGCPSVGLGLPGDGGDCLHAHLSQGQPGGLEECCWLHQSGQMWDVGSIGEAAALSGTTEPGLPAERAPRHPRHRVKLVA